VLGWLTVATSIPPMAIHVVLAVKWLVLIWLSNTALVQVPDTMYQILGTWNLVLAVSFCYYLLLYHRLWTNPSPSSNLVLFMG